MIHYRHFVKMSLESSLSHIRPDSHLRVARLTGLQAVAENPTMLDNYTGEQKKKKTSAEKLQRR